MPGTRKLGRATEHRMSMLKGMVTYLLENGKLVPYAITEGVTDGAFTELVGGEAFEGLDNASELKSNIIIIVNDNDMSIPENHGGLFKNLKLLRETNGKAECNFFKSLGFEYFYVDKGNDVQSLIETFENAKKLGLDEELWNILDLTENRSFRDSSKSRIDNSYKSSKRKYEELEEVLDFLSTIGDSQKDKLMAIATRDKFQFLKEKR